MSEVEIKNASVDDLADYARQIGLEQEAVEGATRDELAAKLKDAGCGDSIPAPKPSRRKAASAAFEKSPSDMLTIVVQQPQGDAGDVTVHVNQFRQEVRFDVETSIPRILYEHLKARVKPRHVAGEVKPGEEATQAYYCIEVRHDPAWQTS